MSALTASSIDDSWHAMPRVRAFVDFLSQQLGETPPWERYLAAKPSKK